MRLTQGSPVVPVHFRDESTLVFDNDVELNEEDGWYRLKANGRDYGMTVSPGVNVDSGNKRVSAGRDERVSFFVLPDSGGSQRIAEAASVSITGTEVHQSASGQDQVSTTLNIRTDDKKPALLALLPYHGQANGESLGSYKTILGTMELYRLNSHNFTTSLSNLDTELRLGGITGQEKARLAGFIRNDTKNLDFESDDTYFAGKELYRAANLLQLANQLDMKEQSKQLRDILGMQLRLWFDVRGSDTRDTRSFYYDETLRGIVGQAPSFGSEDFNDHHFHWGYFIYAAAVLADQDKGFKKEVSPMVNGLINDIASIDQTDGFPRLRVFDKYAGHSWASGFALMADGNNQESSSEAVNAWYATYLWADATGDQRQKDKARWLYAREVDFARRYYLTTDPSEHPQRNGYGSEIVSIVWGGKLDYATFFSDAPEAKLAIQLVPLSPGHAYVGDSEERVAARLDEVGNNPQDYRDYLVMYRATIDPDRALREADELADKDIDGANSWSYMYAWILAQRESQ
jgi:endoglucanase Acf2